LLRKKLIKTQRNLGVDSPYMTSIFQNYFSNNFF
jgi:hypothetical protein